MIVFNFDLLRTIRTPSKYQPPLLIDPNGVLSLTFSPQRLEAISRRDGKIPENDCLIQLDQLPQGNPAQRTIPSTSFLPKQNLSLSVAKRLNHPFPRAAANKSLALATASGVDRHSSGHPRVWPSPASFRVASMPT